MKPTGPFPFVKPALAASLAALLLSACMSSQPVQVVQAPPVVVQPEISADAANYAAVSDGTFTVPAIPVEQIPQTYRRQTVAYETAEAPGTIIIDPANKLLYYVLGNGQAMRYGISVGAEGFQWSGTAVVSNKRTWPRWTPPKEMIARKPSLEKWKDGQPGGPTNPLGSRAIYLTTNGVDYGYRIHGTPEWRSIGRNASSGCFRMINQDVMDLYNRVQGGEKVVVLTKSGEYPTKLNIQTPPKPKQPAQPAPEAVTATPVQTPAVEPVASPALGTTSLISDPNAPTPVSTPEPITSAPLDGLNTQTSVSPAPSVSGSSMNTQPGAPSTPNNSFSVAPSSTFVVQPNTNAPLSSTPSVPAAPTAPAAEAPQLPILLPPAN